MYVITLYNYISLEDATDEMALPTAIHNEFVSVQNAKITKAKNSIDQLSFTIYPDNPGYELVQMLGATIKVYDTERGKYVFDGRVLTPAAAMDADGTAYKEVSCEGLLGYLCDSMQPYMKEKLWEGNDQQTGIQQYLSHLLAVHNAHMPPFKQVFLGEVNIETNRTTENVYKGTNFETTWEVISKKLVDVYGGEIRARRGSDGKIYLDYKEVLGYELRTPIKLGLNLASSNREIDPNQLVTRLYPRGCKLVETSEDENGNVVETETEERLSIAEENGGLPYLDDEKLIKVFGIIEGTHEWDDVTEPINLKMKGEQWLEANNRLPVTTQVSALDLSLIDDDYLPFEIYNWYPVLNDLNEINETLEIVGQTIDIDDPTASTITLGESTTLQSHHIALLEGLKGQVEYLQSQTITTEHNIGYYVKYTMSAIEIAEDRIVSTVGEQLVLVGDSIDIVTQRVSKVEQTAEGITTTISELKQSDEYLETLIEETAEGVKTTVTKGYKDYTDGQIDIVNSNISTLEQTAESIKGSVSTLQGNVTAMQGTLEVLPGQITTTAKNYTDDQVGQIRTTVNSISLSVTDGKLGQNAKIKLTVGQNSYERALDLVDVRQSFADDKSTVEVSGGLITFKSNVFSVFSTNFDVTSDGTIRAVAGKIAGFTISENTIQGDYMRLNHNTIEFSTMWTPVNQRLGSIGSTYVQGDPSTRGVAMVCTTNAQSKFCALGWEDYTLNHTNSSIYGTLKVYYARQAHRTGGMSIPEDSLTIFCNTYLSNYSLKNVGGVEAQYVKTTGYLETSGNITSTDGDVYAKNGYFKVSTYSYVNLYNGGIEATGTIKTTTGELRCQGSIVSSNGGLDVAGGVSAKGTIAAGGAITAGAGISAKGDFYTSKGSFNTQSGNFATNAGGLSVTDNITTSGGNVQATSASAGGIIGRYINANSNMQAGGTIHAKGGFITGSGSYGKTVTYEKTCRNLDIQHHTLNGGWYLGTFNPSTNAWSYENGLNKVLTSATWTETRIDFSGGIII